MEWIFGLVPAGQYVRSVFKRLDVILTFSNVNELLSSVYEVLMRLPCKVGVFCRALVDASWKA